MKQSRWYKIEGEYALIFDSPYEDKSQSVSIVPKEQLSYYRNNYNLRKLWKTEENLVDNLHLY